MNKIIVLGIDGLNYDTIKDNLDRWDLKSFKHLFKSSSYSKVSTPLPSITGTVWPSIYTGCNPGKTGCFDFYDCFSDDNYNRSFLSFDSIRNRAKPFFEILSENNKSVGLYKLPLLNNVYPINGFMVKGFSPAKTEAAYTYPVEIGMELEYNTCKHEIPEFECYDGELKQVMVRFDNFFNNTEYLLKKYKQDMDLFFCCLMEIDYVQHHFYRFTDKNHPLYNQNYYIYSSENYKSIIKFFYKKLDEKISNIIGFCEKNSFDLIILSDHGAGKTYDFFNINKYLLEKKYLNVSDDYSIDYKISKAFSYNISIYLNRKDRYKYGILDKYQADELKGKLIEEFNNLVHINTGKNFIKAIDTEKIYHGNYSKYAPDIIFKQINNSRTAMVSTEKEDLKYFYQFMLADVETGVHHYGSDACFFAFGRNFKKNVKIDLKTEDIAGILLNYFDLKLDENMDSRQINEIFEKNLPAGKKKYYDPKEDFSKKIEPDERTVEVLKNLGYI